MCDGTLLGFIWAFWTVLIFHMECTTTCKRDTITSVLSVEDALTHQKI